jgi:hypothetical protein
MPTPCPTCLPLPTSCPRLPTVSHYCLPPSYPCSSLPFARPPLGPFLAHHLPILAHPCPSPAYPMHLFSAIYLWARFMSSAAQTGICEDRVFFINGGGSRAHRQGPWAFGPLLFVMAAGRGGQRMCLPVDLLFGCEIISPS